MRQRVAVAAEGGVPAPVSSRQGTEARAARSARRRAGVSPMSSTTPTTSDGAPEARHSSIAQSVSSRRAVSASSTRDGASPRPARPGACGTPVSRISWRVAHQKITGRSPARGSSSRRRARRRTKPSAAVRALMWEMPSATCAGFTSCRPSTASPSDPSRASKGEAPGVHPAPACKTCGSPSPDPPRGTSGRIAPAPPLPSSQRRRSATRAPPCG